MADISALGNLNAAEPLDLDKYADVKEGSGASLPKKGKYILRAPDTFPSTAFGATKAGFLSAQIDPTIVGPANEGYTVKFVRVSAKTFQRSKQQVSQIGDYLRACGFRGQVPGDPQALANAVERTAGQTYQAELDWRAYDKETGFTLDGMELFPKNADGEHMPWAPVPGTDDGTGKPRNMRANIQVQRFIAAQS